MKRLFAGYKRLGYPCPWEATSTRIVKHFARNLKARLHTLGNWVVDSYTRQIDGYLLLSISLLGQHLVAQYLHAVLVPTLAEIIEASEPVISIPRTSTLQKRSALHI